MYRAFHDLTRYHLILDNSLFMINIVQKKIQCGDSLNQALLDLLPFRKRNYPRKQIKWENALRSLVIVIDGKGDSLIEKRIVRCRAFPLEFFRSQLAVSLVEPIVVSSNLTWGSNISSKNEPGS